MDKSILTTAKMITEPLATSRYSSEDQDSEWEDRLIMAVLRENSNPANQEFLNYNKAYSEGKRSVDDALKGLCGYKLSNDEKNEFLLQFLFFITGVEDDDNISSTFMA